VCGGALSTYTAGLSTVNVSVIDTGRPQSEAQKGSRNGVSFHYQSTTFLFYFEDHEYIKITGGKSSPLENLQYSCQVCATPTELPSEPGPARPSQQGT